jgi:hypothetical protein
MRETESGWGSVPIRPKVCLVTPSSCVRSLLCYAHTFRARVYHRALSSNNLPAWPAAADARPLDAPCVRRCLPPPALRVSPTRVSCSASFCNITSSRLEWACWAVGDARAMQYYTRQQLQGGGSYAKGVKCGNWNEDTALMEAKLREFVARKEEGACALVALAGIDSCLRMRACASIHTGGAGNTECEAGGVLSTGALPSDKYAVRMRSALMETPLTVVQEGECVHFGTSQPCRLDLASRLTTAGHLTTRTARPDPAAGGFTQAGIACRLQPRRWRAGCGLRMRSTDRSP